MPSLPSLITASEKNSLVYGKLTFCLFVDMSIVRLLCRQEVKFVLLEDNFSSVREHKKGECFQVHRYPLKCDWIELDGIS